MDLDSAAFDIDKAATTARTALSQLRLSDGAARYAPPEEARLREAALTNYDRTVTSVLEAVDAEVQRFTQEAARLEAQTPIDRLDAEQLARANQLDTFVRQDAERLGVSLLNQRLRAVIDGGDDVQVILNHRHAAARLSVERQGKEELDSPALRELSTMVSELGRKLEDPRAKQKQQAARERAKAGNAVRGKANLLRQSLTGVDPLREALSQYGAYAPY